MDGGENWLVALHQAQHVPPARQDTVTPLRPASPTGAPRLVDGPSELAKDSPITEVFGTPELAKNIFDLLNYHDEASCARVSKFFNDSVKKFNSLYRSNLAPLAPHGRHAKLKYNQNPQTFIYFLDSVFEMHPNGCSICNAVHRATRLVHPSLVDIFDMHGRRQWRLNHHPKELDVEQVVIYLNRLKSTDKYVLDVPLTPAPVPNISTNKTLTIVLFPLYWNHGAIVSKAFSFRHAKFEETLLDVLVDYAIVNCDRKVTIVGLENANPFAPKAHWDQRGWREVQTKHDFFLALQGRLTIEKSSEYNRSLPWFHNSPKHKHETLLENINDEHKPMIMSNVSFRTFKEYLESGEWRNDNILDYQVGAWLNALDKAEKNPRPEFFMCPSKPVSTRKRKAADPNDK